MGLKFGVTIGRVLRGQHRAQPATCQKIAEFLNLPIEQVVAACDESFRRAHPEQPASPVGV